MEAGAKKTGDHRTLQAPPLPPKQAVTHSDRASPVAANLPQCRECSHSALTKQALHNLGGCLGGGLEAVRIRGISQSGAVGMFDNGGKGLAKPVACGGGILEKRTGPVLSKPLGFLTRYRCFFAHGRDDGGQRDDPALASAANVLVTGHHLIP